MLDSCTTLARLPRPAGKPQGQIHIYRVDLLIITLALVFATAQFTSTSKSGGWVKNAS